MLDHFDHEINTVLGGVQTEDGERRNVHVMLLAGSDLIGTMSEPGVWSYQDVSLIHLLPVSAIDDYYSSTTSWGAMDVSSLNARAQTWTKPPTVSRDGAITSI